MQFTDYFARKIRASPGFDFLSKCPFDKRRFRRIDVAFEFFAPLMFHKTPVLPLSAEKRSELRAACSLPGSPDITWVLTSVTLCCFRTSTSFYLKAGARAFAWLHRKSISLCSTFIFRLAARPSSSTLTSAFLVT